MARRWPARRARRTLCGMSPAPLFSDSRPDGQRLGLRESLYRYFFHAWLFQDADSGSALDRANAVRHNRAQARWLPLYLWRWLVCGALVAALEQLAERLLPQSIVPGVLGLLLVLIAMHLLITAICWAFLVSAAWRRRE